MFNQNVITGLSGVNVRFLSGDAFRTSTSDVTIHTM